MPTPSTLEALELLIAALKADATLTAVVPAANIGNHMTQDATLPVIVVRVADEIPWDTKSSVGSDMTFVFDVWTGRHSDYEILQVKDALLSLLHNTPLTGAVSGQSLLLRYERGSIFTEPDGVSHHGVFTYRHIFTGG